MKDAVGDPTFPIWLIADSEPKSWHSLLLTPLDPRHPARHSIWTSILDSMQEVLYRLERLRFASDRLYITNAVKQPEHKPMATAVDWPESLQEKSYSLGEKLSYFKPKILLTFGAFAFEFVRRACGEAVPFPFGHWTTRRLGEEFRKRISLYDSMRINILPLLHVSISRGRFLESHSHFVGDVRNEPANYFEFVGMALAQLFLRQCKQLPIWVSGMGVKQTP